MLYGTAYNDIYANLISNSSRGIQLGAPNAGDSKYDNVYGNNLQNNYYGIECYSAYASNIYENNITESIIGIGVYSSPARIFENNLKNCSIGIDIVCSNNLVYHNNFMQNRVGVSISDQYLFGSGIIMAYSTNNTFDLGYPSGGNYWSDYNGTDADGDGVGDTPYVVSKNCTDHYPLMYPYDIEKDTIALPKPTPTPTPTPTPLPASTVETAAIASLMIAVIVGGGLLVYFKKRKH